MPDFHRVKAPVFSPTMCLICSTHQHPDGFVDTGVDLNPPHGRAYLCAGCVYQLARVLGCLSPVDVEALQGHLERARAAASALEADLETERDHKTVNVPELLAMLRHGKNGQQDPNGLSAIVPGLCHAKRVDGYPCSAKALPGRDVCVAHSRQPAGVVPVAGVDPDAEVD